MRFSSKIIQQLSKYLAASPAKIRPCIHKRNIASSKLKDVLGQLPPSSFEDFIWLSTLRADARFDCHTLSILRRISVQESKETLKQLLHNHLIYQVDNNSYRLHESLRVFSEHLLTSKNSQHYCLTRLGINWTDAQQKVILETQKQYESFNFQQDIYFAENILWHIHEAQWEGRIHSVISSLFPLNRWHQTIADLVLHEQPGIDALFLEAKTQATANLSQHPSDTFNQLSIYALMQGTQRILLEAIPEHWAKRLLKSKVWSIQQGLSYILSQSDVERKAHSIALLGRYFIPEYTSVLLTTVESLNSDYAKAIAIKGIFRLLESREKKNAIELIKKIQDESYQSLCISAIAQHIPLTMMLQTYFIIEKIEDEAEQAKALSQFLKFCTPPLKKQCIGLIRNYQDPHLTVRLFNQIKEDVPHLKPQIIEIAQQLERNYITTSILWSELNPRDQTIDTIQEWLKGDMPELDKVLFFSERITEVNDRQKRKLWTCIHSQDAWASATGSTPKQVDESLWANAVIGCLGEMTEREVHSLLQQIKHLKSSEIQAELCLQLLPFTEKQAHLDDILQIIQSLPELGHRLKTSSQAVDYLPQLRNEITEHLPKLDDAIANLEIQIFILEREPDIAPFFLQALQECNDDILKFHFLRQSLDLIPDRYLSNALTIILHLNTDEQRNELLNTIETRLTIQDITGLVYDLSSVIYPSQQLTNTAKQIYRYYWESGSDQSKVKLSKALLSQLPSSNTAAKLSDKDLIDILAVSNHESRSKVLSLHLQDINWANLKDEHLLEIFEALSNGAPQRFIEQFSYIAVGIAQSIGVENLPSYGNVCEQLGDIPQSRPVGFNPQNTGNIYHKFESQEFLPKTA